MPVRAAREGQGPDQSLGSDMPAAEGHSEALTSFLPQWPVPAEVWSLPDSCPDQTGCLFTFPSPPKR